MTRKTQPIPSAARLSDSTPDHELAALAAAGDARAFEAIMRRRADATRGTA